MNNFSVFASACFVLLLSTSFASAQDDEARAASGLPTMIGRQACTSSVPGADGIVSGSVTIIGLSEQEKQPVLTVSVLANGVPVTRERVKNRGAFTFSCVPRNGVSIIVEVDGMEIGSYPLGPLNPPPLTNRQDVQLTWSQVTQVGKMRNEATSLRNSYQRSAENQKAFDKAIANLRENKKDNSLKLFKQITQADANDFVAWTELGTLYFSTERLEDAEAAYAKALSLKPDFSPALLNLGKLRITQKKPDEAIETLTKALAATPESPDVNQYVGEAYLLARKGSKAVGYLNKALELAPLEKAEIHLRLAALYIAAGAKKLAADQYKMFLQKVPNHPEKAAMEKYISENGSSN